MVEAEWRGLDLSDPVVRAYRDWLYTSRAVSVRVSHLHMQLPKRRRRVEDMLPRKRVASTVVQAAEQQREEGAGQVVDAHEEEFLIS